MTIPLDPADEIPAQADENPAPAYGIPAPEIPPDAGGSAPGLAEPQARRRSRRTGRLPVIVLAVLGLAGVLGGGAALALELTRAATPAEETAALQKEIATRWERLPAGKIFPATIRYTDTDGNPTVARLVGIAPAVSCRAALEPADYALIRDLGCVTILRATYVDASGTLATTAGVAILRSPAAARQAANDAVSLAPGDGLHAVSFGGTITAQFGDAARGTQGGLASGPYLFLYTAGFTDGQPTTAAAQMAAELGSFGQGIDGGLRVVLTGHGKPCEMKDIQC